MPSERILANTPEESVNPEDLLEVLPDRFDHLPMWHGRLDEAEQRSGGQLSKEKAGGRCFPQCRMIR